MAGYHIDKDLSEFAHKNVSAAPNNSFSIAMILLVLVSAAQNGHSVNATAVSPDADSVFYRIDSSIRRMQDLFWQQSLRFLRKKKEKLHRRKCYITVDETHDSYTGKLHKKPLKELTKEQRTIRQYIHKYKPKNGDTGSFKYLVFSLVYGKKRRVLRVKALKRKESYWFFIGKTLKELSKEVSFECALMDRGFYVAELVDQLQREDIPFLIRAKLYDSTRTLYGIYWKWASYTYLFDNWLPTNLVLGRDFKGDEWGFLTNLHVKRLENLRHIYKKRWNTENIFKATDGIQLRIATSNHKTRMFSVYLSFLIYNAWQERRKKPTLLNHIKRLFKTILTAILQLCPHRDRLKLNIPIWEFVTLNSASAIQKHFFPSFC